ncbi:hypothetical protein FNH08_39350 [Streptomyces spongiae]|uniref:SseB family protein n=1 Tax=Streptomyces spongiae TaxID=565072 RepID=A0A5N8XUT2_9ACTN|nr:SAV_915 family protein [Streptomyces spongiae]MPY62996.1 hypothetical protein [Streptomyces spongiae]
MPELSSGEDPEPSERIPAGPLFVPVRQGPAGCVARLFRTPLGERTAVGFTSRGALTATLGGPGVDQAWIRIAGPALRARPPAGDRRAGRPCPTPRTPGVHGRHP